MAFTEIPLMDDMTTDQRVLFQSQYHRAQKHRSTAVVLTLLLGGVGGHRFYLNQVGLGVLYLVFCFTFIPLIVSCIEVFLIGSRVDAYNRVRAIEIATQVRLLSPARE